MLKTLIEDGKISIPPPILPQMVPSLDLAKLDPSLLTQTEYQINTRPSLRLFFKLKVKMGRPNSTCLNPSQVRSTCSSNLQTHFLNINNNKKNQTKWSNGPNVGASKNFQRAGHRCFQVPAHWAWPVAPLEFRRCKKMEYCI